MSFGCDARCYRTLTAVQVKQLFAQKKAGRVWPGFDV
jgi:hypothetical protein